MRNKTGRYIVILVLLTAALVLTSASIATAAIRYEETSPSVAWTGTWTNYSNTSYSGGATKYSNDIGASATLAFSGTSVNLVACVTSNRGIAKIYVDGVYQQDVDLYSVTTEYMKVVYTKSGLSSGSHTIEVEVTGTKNASSSNSIVDVDAFDVQSPISRFEESSPNVTWTGVWNNYSSSSYSGGATKYTDQPGATATLSFNGTSVTLISAETANRGIAKVYVDDVYQQEIDLYSATIQYQRAVYTKSGLVPGAHTIKIEATGTKNPSSSNYYVDVDAFDLPDLPPSDPTNLGASGISSNQINLAWNPSTDDIGLVGYKVVRSTDGVTFFEIGTSSTTSFSDSGLSPSTTYYYRVRAYDTASNESGYSNVASATTTVPSTATRHEDTSTSITYTGTWDTGTNTNFSGGTEKYSSTTGSTASLTFYGNSANWIAAKGSDRGIASVYIDGVLDSSVDLYNSSPQYRQVVYSKTALPSSHHTIRVEVTATKNALSSGYVVGLDAIDIESVPDTTPPSAPSNLSATAISTSGISLVWDPATDNKGVAGYRIERSIDGSTFTEIGTSTATSYSDGSLSPGTAYYFRVRAYDAAGNNGNYSNTASTTTLRPPESTRYENTDSAISYVGTASLRHEETDPAIAWTGTWTNYSNASYSGGATKYTNETGATSTFSFSEDRVTLLSCVTTNRGIAKIYVDGVFEQDVDLYSGNTEYWKAVYTKSGLATGTHTITVEVTGTKNPLSSNSYVDVDAFAVPTSAWQLNSDPNLSGGSESYSDTAGTTATLTFSGTDVFLVATRAPDRGTAKVYLDGIYLEDVELFSATTLSQETVFSRNSLSSGSHTLRIEVSGTKNPASSGYKVGIDAFDVVAPPVSVVTTVQTDPDRPDAYGGWFRTIPTISLTPNVSATSYYQWDGTSGPWTTYTSAFDGLGGTHTLYFYSTDTSGGTESVKVKRFKVDTSIATVGTHAGCAGCHGSGSSYVGGDHTTYWTGTLHDTALSTNPAGCERCHAWTSNLSKLLRSPVLDATGVEHIVIGNDNTLCGACHSAADNAYMGLASFQASKHFQTGSSNLALTSYPDASYSYGMCGNCHNPHGVAGTTDYARAAGNALCASCHDDSALPVKPQNYSYQGATTFGATQHGSTSNAYNVWPTPNDTGAGIGTGGSTSGQCINCHNPHGKFTKETLAEGENLCYGGASGGCHASTTGSSQGRNIYQEFAGSSDRLSRHSLTDTEQSAGGSKLECTNCHNSHLNTATNKVINPENKSLLYTATMTDPKSGLPVMNYVGFCDKCHNGFPPSGVTMPSTMLEIKLNYESNPPDQIAGGIDETGDWHGVKSGTGWGGSLLAPYSRGMAALVCMDCHESHGSSNVYHFKTTVNGKTGISVTDALGRGADSFCTACHSGERHAGCLGAQCHSGDPVPPDSSPPGNPTPCFQCHSHGGIKNWPYPSDVPGEDEGCTHCHNDWYPYN
jgi:predicted CXXCH cytochrome family protein